MKKNALVFLLVAILILTIPAAQAKTYVAKKATAKQIVTELNKTTGLIKKTFKADTDISDMLKLPNYYKSKYNFTDKKYKYVYCSVEVYRDSYDAVMRHAEINTLSWLYGTFEQEEDVPLQACRYKNIVIRVGGKMPISRVLKYYNALKKILK